MRVRRHTHNTLAVKAKAGMGSTKPRTGLGVASVGSVEHPRLLVESWINWPQIGTSQEAKSVR